jgi:multiple sugar transport system substrate-binding protein
MTAITLNGLSWGHRRATAPLRALSAAFTRRHPGIDIRWTDRTLEDFEAQGIAETARRFDLVVCDHPFCGDIVASGAFLPLEDLLPEPLSPAAAARYVGPSLASYRFAGHVWAAPVDGATQNAIWRADLLQGLGAAAPASFAEALALGRKARSRGLYLGFAARSPHTLLSIASIMANRGQAWSAPEQGPLTIDMDSFFAALQDLRELAAYCPPEIHEWNSIDLHEAMTQRDDIVYSPCVFGYATYGEADQRRRLSFGPFAGPQAPYAAGNTIGGAGIALSAHCQTPDAARAFLQHVLDPVQQARQVAAAHGQPAMLDAWRDPAVDVAFHGYFSGVGASLDLAWTRPRLRGYPRFQDEAGELAAQLLRGDIDDGQGRERLERLIAELNGNDREGTS